MNQDGTTKAEMLCTLFYISSAEMEKPEKEMKVPLILVCAEEAGRLDARFKPSEAERDEFAGSIARLAADAPAHRRRLSKRAIVILVAAAILLITALTVYAVITDVFSLFFNDPREMLEWKDGESRRIGNYEMIISSELQQFDTIEELKSVIDVPIICPDEYSENTKITGIYYRPLKDKPAVYIDYTFNNVQINYTIDINCDRPTQEEVNSYEYERIETENNNLFFIMESEIGYQALARIGDNVYTISSSNKDDIIHFIKNVKEL